MIRFLNKLRNRFSYDLAIDLGSKNTLLYQKGKGIVLDEPSVIAYQKKSHGRRIVFRTGSGVQELLGQNHDDLTIVRPVQHGRIIDFTAAREMLTCFLNRIGNKWVPAFMRAIASVPAQATDEDKKIVRALIRSAGVNEVYLIEEPKAVAAGAGIDISEEGSTMVIDIGGAITEMAVLRGKSILCARSIPIGGEDLDLAVAGLMQEQYGLRIDSHVAESVKIRRGAAFPGPEKIPFTVEGRDIETGALRSVEVNSHDICKALSKPLGVIIHTINDFIGGLPHELFVNILDRGIILSGGSSLLRNLDRLLERETLFPFILTKDPLACQVLGSGDMLEYINQYE